MPFTLPKFGFALVAYLATRVASRWLRKRARASRFTSRTVHPVPRSEGRKRSKELPELPLTGDKSLAQLDRCHCPHHARRRAGKARRSEGGKRVSAYIYDAFYSPTAQAKLNPPRIELSRLTVKQYRNTIADVIGSFRFPPKPDGKEGLRGEYFNSRNFQGNKRLIDRTDAEVKFDFAKDGPAVAEDAKEKFDPNTFCIKWEGSVWAPDTGMYEFVVRIDHALRLWVNNNRRRRRLMPG